MPALSFIALSVLVAFLSGLFVLQLLLSPRWRELAVDRPNERSLHQTSVPRTGGIAVLLGAAAGFGPAWTFPVGFLGGIALVLGSVSFLDDRRGLPVSVRLVAQLAAAVAAVILIGWNQPWWWLLLGSVATVWMTNLYNFMDGSDGLAGGMGVSGFAAYACASAGAADMGLAVLSACVAAACAAFLTRNYPPARIFMGDVGSTALGFLAATVGLYGHARGLWPLWFPALVFLPFALDATVTLIRRALRGDKVWRAHREHYYQRLIRSGWSHPRMARVAHVVMLGTAASAVLVLEHFPGSGWWVLAGWLALLGLLMRAVDRRWARHTAPSLGGMQRSVNEAPRPSPAPDRPR